MRVLVTFGALRAPELPEVPTFADIVVDPKAAYTTSVAVFCSPGADATFASRATAALLSIADKMDVPIEKLGNSRGKLPLNTLL